MPVPSFLDENSKTIIPTQQHRL